MPHLYAYCDESGKHHEHRIVVFNALVSSFQKWERFSRLWALLLARYGLNEFHATAALEYSRPYGSMKPGTADMRAQDVLPFVRLIVESIDLGVVAAIDVAAYKLPKLHAMRLNISDDPHYFAFYVAISEIMRYRRVLPDHSVGLILDDDEEKAVPVYKFLSRMRKANEEAHRRITSICFMDDRSSPQVQAADLFTYLLRIDAQRRFLGKEHRYPTLCEAFEKPMTGKECLEIVGGFYSEPQLMAYMETRQRECQ